MACGLYQEASWSAASLYQKVSLPAVVGVACRIPHVAAVATGATREAAEEGMAKVHINGPLCIYSLPHLSQVHMWFHASLHLPDNDVVREAVASDCPTILSRPIAQKLDQGDSLTKALEQQAEAYGFAPGHETLAAGLFPWSAVPWDELAFSSGAAALRFFLSRQPNEVDVQTIAPMTYDR